MPMSLNSTLTGVPIDTKTLRRFSVSNLALFTPLISKVAGNSEVFQNLEKLAKAIFSGQ
jgi:hypothetical protein